MWCRRIRRSIFLCLLRFQFQIVVRWTFKEDQKLKRAVKKVGGPKGGHIRDWGRVATLVRRCKDHCRDRWQDFLCPHINNAPWEPEEDRVLLRVFISHGPLFLETVASVLNQSTFSEMYRTRQQVRNRLHVLLPDMSQDGARSLLRTMSSHQGNFEEDETIKEVQTQKMYNAEIRKSEIKNPAENIQPEEEEKVKEEVQTQKLYNAAEVQIEKSEMNNPAENIQPEEEEKGKEVLQTHKKYNAAEVQIEKSEMNNPAEENIQPDGLSLLLRHYSNDDSDEESGVSPCSPASSSRANSMVEMRIVMGGLAAAGKTSILSKLKLGEVVISTSTIGVTVETVEYKNISFSFTVWDLVGQDKIRPLWRQDFQNTRGLIFVVDSSDHDLIIEARNELHRMLNEDELRDAVLLVLANKLDLPNAMGAAELTEKLGLHSLGERHWYILSTCAISGEGLYEGLDWLSNNIANKA